MKTIRTIIIALTLLGSVWVCGQSLAYEEPDNFAGLKFGEDIRTQDLHKCSNLDAPTSRLRCYTGTGAAGHLKNVSEIERMVNEIFYAQINDKLESIQLTFSSGLTTTLLAVLTERYGSPTATVERPWQSVGGLKTTSTHVEWTGNNVWIIFDERAGKVNEGRVMYRTSVSREHAMQLQKELRKKAVGGL
jgi:hypothetical protein